MYLRNDRNQSGKHGNDMFTNYGYIGFDMTSLKHVQANGMEVNIIHTHYDNAGNSYPE